MAIEEYVPTQWVDGTTPDIDAANLNHLEQALKRATDTITVLETKVAQLELAPVAHTHSIGEVVNLQVELDRTPKGTWARAGDVLTIDIEGS